MKTAMQELLELCKHYQATFQNPIGEIVKKIESELLEKEKEQIMEAYDAGQLHFWPDEFLQRGGYYYNETFNANEE
jgi:hypothetical protein